MALVQPNSADIDFRKTPKLAIVPYAIVNIRKPAKSTIYP